MKPLTISDSENMILALQDEIHRNETSRYDHRLHAVLLVAQGMTCPEVGRILGDSPRAVLNWVRRFEDEGLSGLAEGERSGRPARLTAEQILRVEDALRADPNDFGLSTRMWDGPTLSAFLRKQLGVNLKVRQCQRLFRRLGFRLRKPALSWPTATPSCRLRIKKLRRLAKSPGIDLWAMDEVHFQQHGSRCRMWVPPECKDPVCRHAPTRKSISYFGAVRLGDGRLVMSQPHGHFDAQTCWDFLRKLERSSRRKGRTIVVITDNARYHHALLHKSCRDQVEGHFRLHFIPPYSPELTPIERVWKLFRRRCLHNEHFENLEVLAKALTPLLTSWS